MLDSLTHSGDSASALSDISRSTSPAQLPEMQRAPRRQVAPPDRDFLSCCSSRRPWLSVKGCALSPKTAWPAGVMSPANCPSRALEGMAVMVRDVFLETPLET